MSWHTSALVIEGSSNPHGAELLAELGFPGLQPLFETDDPGAGFLPGKVVGIVDGWTVVWDPQTFFGLFPLDDHAAPPDGPWDMFESSIWPSKLDRILARMSSERRVFSFIAEGAAGSCGFAWYSDGSRRRAWLSLEGETVLQDGAPLGDEAIAEAEERDEEQRLLVLCRMLTRVDVARVTAVRFMVYGIPRPGAVARSAHLVSSFAAQLVARLSSPRTKNAGGAGPVGKPGTFPVVALRDLVVFPGTVVPFSVGRVKSLRAAEAAMRTSGHLVLACQKNAADDDPAADAICTTGTLTNLIQFLELPDGSAKVLTEAIGRVKILNFTARAEYHEANITPVNDDAGGDLRPLITRACTTFGVYAQHNGFHEALVESVVQQCDNYGLFADRIATHLLIDVHDKQRILETVPIAERLEILLNLMNKPQREQEPHLSLQEIVSEFSHTGAPSRQIALALPTEDAGPSMAVDRLVAVHGDGRRTGLFDGTLTLPCPLTLDDLELRLNESQFVRVHRNHIVNISHIAAIRRDGGDILLELVGTPTSTVPVSRGRLSWLKTRRAVRLMRQIRAASGLSR